MKRFRSYFLSAAGVLTAVSALVLFSPQRMESQFSSPVRVVNTTSQWVPNRDTDNPARNTYTDTVVVNIANSQSESCVNFKTIPANTRVVVEMVDLFGLLQPNQHYGFMLEYGALIRMPITLTSVFTFGNFPNNNTLMGSQLVRAYLDQNTTPQGCLLRDSISGGGQIIATISGYVVSLP
jgi:hypothetical protein